MSTDREAGTRSQLPYWVEQSVGYGGQVFLHGLMLGFTRAQWPIQAFAVDEDGGCAMGARWAAEKPHDRVLVGPIPIPDDVPVKTARHVPERFDLTEPSPDLLRPAAGSAWSHTGGDPL